MVPLALTIAGAPLALHSTVLHPAKLWSYNILCAALLHSITDFSHVTAPGKGRHIEFSDVGQNTIELWTLEAGGGWVHPVHIHLVVSCCQFVQLSELLM